MRETNELVSIVMNCFNGSEYLREALDSVVAQTYTNWELIFWDNQSTDNSLNIVNSYQDSRFRVFRASKHTRLYEARNQALGKANGKYIAFLDTDDWWEVDKIAIQVPFFEDPTVGLVYGRYWFVDQGKNCVSTGPEGHLPTGHVLNRLLEKNYVGILTMMTRRSAMDSLEGPFNPKYHIIGDTDLVIRLAVNWRFEAVARPIASYRWHDNNETKLQTLRHVEEWTNWLECTGSLRSMRKYPGFAKREKSILKLAARSWVFDSHSTPVKTLLSRESNKIKKGMLFVLLKTYMVIYLIKRAFTNRLGLAR